MSEKRGTPGCPFCGARSTFPGSMFAESYTCGTRRSIGDEDYHTGDKCDKACFRKCCIEKGEQLKEAEAEITRLREELESMTLERNTYRDRVEDLKLAAKAGLVLAKGSKETEDKLRQENERLRKDAERYKYIRCGRRTTAIYEYFRGERFLKLEHQLDSAIDATKEAQQ